VISSNEFIDEIQEKEMAKARKARKSARKKIDKREGEKQREREGGRETESQLNLENLMGELKLEDSPLSKGSSMLIGSGQDVAEGDSNTNGKAEEESSKPLGGEVRHKERVKSTIKTRRPRPKSSKESPTLETKNSAASSPQHNLSMATANKATEEQGLAPEPKGTLPAPRLLKSETSSDSTASVESKPAELDALGSAAEEEQEDVDGAICEGDTRVINDFLPGELEQRIFERVRDEVLWQKMSHRGGDVPRL